MVLSMQRIVVIVNREILCEQCVAEWPAKGPGAMTFQVGSLVHPGAPRAMHRDSAEPSNRRGFVQLKTSEIK